MINDAKISFILYKKYYDILKDFDDSDMGILFRAILQYQATGDEPQLPVNVGIAFRFIKNQFDLDEKKYDEFVEKQSANGKKGGRPKVEKETQENPKNPSLFLKTQKSLNENEKENENVNENENENENVSLLSEERVVGVGVNVGEMGNSEEDRGKERGERKHTGTDRQLNEWGEGDLTESDLADFNVLCRELIRVRSP